MSSKKRGRPAGKIKTSKIEITLEPEIKEQFMQITHENNSYCSVLIREWIIEYIAQDSNKKE